MTERMIPRSHAREIADLCVDVADKAHEWKVRAKAAEARYAALHAAADAYFNATTNRKATLAAPALRAALAERSA